MNLSRFRESPSTRTGAHSYDPTRPTRVALLIAQDISGRSPILHADSYNSRTSLDSRTFQLSRPSLHGNTFDRPEPVRDDSFDDVKLNDEATKTQPKKKSFLSRFSESNNDTPSESKDGKHHFHFPGRKRGQSGSGSELGEVKRPESQGKQKPEVTAG